MQGHEDSGTSVRGPTFFWAKLLEGWCISLCQAVVLTSEFTVRLVAQCLFVIIVKELSIPDELNIKYNNISNLMIEHVQLRYLI